MEWTRSETIGLALPSCTQCRGMGLRPTRGMAVAPCSCVFRAIFRACYTRFYKLVHKEKHLCRVTLEYGPRGGGRITWARKDEEYIADFYLVTRRTLSAAEWKVFSYHYLLGAEWRLCARRLNLDRGQFFHTIYRIEAKLGKTFRELKPYALYPLDEYFNGRTENTWGTEEHAVFTMRPGSLAARLDVPVQRAA